MIDSNPEAAELAVDAGLDRSSRATRPRRRRWSERASSAPASVVTALSGDAENLFVTVSARSLNPDVVHRRAIVSTRRPRPSSSRPGRIGSSRQTSSAADAWRRWCCTRPSRTTSTSSAATQGVEFRLQEVELAHGLELRRQVACRGSHSRDAPGRRSSRFCMPTALSTRTRRAATVLRAGQRLVVLGSADQVAVLTEQACQL